MEFDVMLEPRPVAVGDALVAAKAQGRAGGWVIETRHDPFLLLAEAAARGTGLPLGTAVAVALARNPMLLATMGNDLQTMARGGFSLGLGSQVRPHIERRFSMPWGKPVARMREMIAAIHAIWDCWEGGGRLGFQGEFYRHTLMTAAFDPGPNPFGRPPILLGALGPHMTRLAGEIADGLVVHRFMSEKYLTEVTLPQIEAGLARRARPLSAPFRLVFPPFVVAATDDDFAVTAAGVRSQIAFYASTESYHGMLDLHGLGELGRRLNGLARQRDWAAMEQLIGDDVLEVFAVVCRPGEVESALESRFGPAVDRAILYPEEHPHHL